MTVAPPSSREKELTLRSRIVGAAARATVETGWSSVTMGKLADLVGVSRQTVYNEIGGKQQLAEAIVLAELQNFLTAVDAAFEAYPGDLVNAVRRACHNVLVLATKTPLLHAIVSASHGAGHDLLPLLTTQSRTLIETAKTVLREHVEATAPALPARELDVAIDTVVRTVLSHIMQPSASPDRTADDIALLVERFLAGVAS
ncbi:TetR family transcriptional regulator [Amycolatopsis sp. NPDC059027]|uniref:TetR/AcrR family transcriptional regulator n=1 Tax=unclassified Amycolatopsis TaxID=2618356 RepID=UPI003673331C